MAGGFVALPFSVLDAMIGLSHTAKSLLLEVARQYTGANNGSLLLTDKYLRKRDWKSPTVILRAKRELLDAGLIHETVKGHRPNRASWYAITWQDISKNPAYDAGAEKSFVRGAFHNKVHYSSLKNTSVTTPKIVAGASNAIAEIAENPVATTGEIAVRPVLSPSLTISPVVHLESPSAVCVLRGGSVLGSGVPPATASKKTADTAAEAYRRASRG